MKKITLSLIFYFAIIVSAQAQSAFLEKDQDGFGINGGLLTNVDLNGFSGSVGYSFSGVFDLGISAGRYGFNRPLFGEDLKVTTISPYASYLVVKQDEHTSVSFALNGSYQRHIYSNQVLSDNNIDLTGSFLTIGASLNRMIKSSEEIRLQPGIGFDYITGQLNAEDSIGLDTESDNTKLLTLGLSLIFHTSPSYTFVVTPALGFGEDVTNFSISLSFVFPQN